MLRLKYTNISPTSKADSTITCTDKKTFIDLDELKEDNLTVTQYASCEHHRTKLDGNFPDLPDIVPAGRGYESLSLSGSDGAFAVPIVITRTFVSSHTAPGITFTFDDGDDECYCDSLNVKWYRDATLLYDKDYTPDGTTYFCEQNVTAFNSIAITFNSTNKPYRFLRIREIEDGVIKDFYRDELEGLAILEEISESGEALSINTLDAQLKTKSSIEYLFQRTQPLELYDDETLIGRFFVGASKRITENKYNLSTTDYIGLLENERFVGGMYSAYSAATLITEILGDIAHDYVGAATITGYIPVCTKRQALQYIAFEIGYTIDCSRTDKISFAQLSDTATEIPISRVNRNPEQTTEQIVTRVQLTEHKFIADTGTASELLNEAVTGTITLIFTEPHHTYAITGGTIVTSGVNYVTLTGTGATVVLTGKAYKHITRVISQSNPLTTASDIPNVVEKSENTLINSANSATVLARISPIYFRQKTIKAKIKIVSEKAGDMVSLTTPYGTVTGRIISIELNPRTMYADVTISEVNDG